MLNTKKLLYVLPDVAYVAELLPTKKEHVFSIQSFRQVNGEFMDDNEFLAQNVLKLFGKLEPDEYHLVLPDFLFTNTIVSVAEKSDSKIKDYLKSTLLPNLDLSEDTHQIETFVLTEFKGTAKVQLSAIEKTVLAPIRVAAASHSLKITAVSPLSWTIKSLISLEPSISVIQIGSKLYSALHLLGVDQTTMTDVGETDAIAETIKTLKGGEPNIQTVYLLSNELVQNKLKEHLANTVPLQQLTTFAEDDSQMPSYVKEIIESGMKTLSIPEFPVPRFELGKPSDADADAVAASASTSQPADDDDDTVEEVSAPELTTEQDEVTSLAPGEDPESLPAPTLPPALSAGKTAVELVSGASEAPITIDHSPEENSTVNATPPRTETSQDTASTEEGSPMPTDTVTETTGASTSTTDTAQEPLTAAPTEVDDAELSATLSNFAPDSTKNESARSAESNSTAETTAANTSKPETAAPVTSDTPTVLKNNSGVSTMLKMVFITLAVFFATVAVGVGVGLGLLQFSSKDSNTSTPEASPIAAASPEPIVEPSPSASASAAIDPAQLKVLVVNATTKAGYAGTIKAALEKAEFSGVAAGNAKGEYADGNTLLVAEDMVGVEDLIEDATDLTFTVNSDAADKKTEDAAGTYDVIVVLAE